MRSFVATARVFIAFKVARASIISCSLDAVTGFLALAKLPRGHVIHLLDGEHNIFARDPWVKYIIAKVRGVSHVYGIFASGARVLIRIAHVIQRFPQVKCELTQRHILVHITGALGRVA
jgi:hypothetical protein